MSYFDTERRALVQNPLFEFWSADREPSPPHMMEVCPGWFVEYADGRVDPAAVRFSPLPQTGCGVEVRTSKPVRWVRLWQPFGGITHANYHIELRLNCLQPIVDSKDFCLEWIAILTPDRHGKRVFSDVLLKSSAAIGKHDICLETAIGSTSDERPRYLCLQFSGPSGAFALNQLELTRLDSDRATETHQRSSELLRLEEQLAEANANISVRFDEIATLTKMLEELRLAAPPRNETKHRQHPASQVGTDGVADQRSQTGSAPRKSKEASFSGKASRPVAVNANRNLPFGHDIAQAAASTFKERSPCVSSAHSPDKGHRGIIHIIESNTDTWLIDMASSHLCIEKDAKKRVLLWDIARNRGASSCARADRLLGRLSDESVVLSGLDKRPNGDAAFAYGLEALAALADSGSLSGVPGKLYVLVEHPEQIERAEACLRSAGRHGKVLHASPHLFEGADSSGLPTRCWRVAIPYEARSEAVAATQHGTISVGVVVSTSHQQESTGWVNQLNKLEGLHFAYLMGAALELDASTTDMQLQRFLTKSEIYKILEPDILIVYPAVFRNLRFDSLVALAITHGKLVIIVADVAIPLPGTIVVRTGEEALSLVRKLYKDSDYLSKLCLAKQKEARRTFGSTHHLNRIKTIRESPPDRLPL